MIIIAVKQIIVFIHFPDNPKMRQREEELKGQV